MAQVFPSFVEDENNEFLMAPVSKGEAEVVIQSMQKEKSPGPDGWTMEIFQQFFDLIGDGLVGLVAESRSRGCV